MSTMDSAITDATKTLQDGTAELMSLVGDMMGGELTSEDIAARMRKLSPVQLNMFAQLTSAMESSQDQRKHAWALKTAQSAVDEFIISDVDKYGAKGIRFYVKGMLSDPDKAGERENWTVSITLRRTATILNKKQREEFDAAHEAAVTPASGADDADESESDDADESGASE